MLTEVVDLFWRGDEPALGNGRFPPYLLQCAAEHDHDLGPFLVRVGLIYRSQGILLTDTLVHWDEESEAIVFTHSEQSVLQRRLTLANTAPHQPIERPVCGIAERLSRPLYGGDIAEILGPSPFSVPEASAWIFEPTTNHSEGNFKPDAIAFHSITLPASMTLKIEPTTRCNFDCGFCYGRHLAQGDLSKSFFDEVLARFPDLKGVEITGEGEPLLNKNVYGFIEHLSNRGIYTHITTNGSALNYRNINKLIDANLKSIAVSMESLNPEKFARYRPGGIVEDVKAGLQRLVMIKKKRKVDLTVSLWTTLMRDTLDEIPDFNHFVKSSGIDCFESFQTLNPMPSYRKFYNQYLLENMLNDTEVAEIINSPETHPEIRTALENATAVYQQNSCDIFMNTAMVNWQGEMTPCCLLKVPDFLSLGNLCNESLKTVWEKPSFEIFRFALQHGIVLKACKGCPDVAAARNDWKPVSC